MEAELLTQAADVATVLEQHGAIDAEAATELADGYGGAAAALAVGLAALGAGYAERGIGSAAVGAIAEDSDMFVPGLIMTVLPETLVILALVVIFLV